jgi:hypothetical protein
MRLGGWDNWDGHRLFCRLRLPMETLNVVPFTIIVWVRNVFHHPCSGIGVGAYH